MNLQQIKLTKEEWQSIEIPVSDKEKEILQLILKGFHDVNLKEFIISRWMVMLAII